MTDRAFSSLRSRLRGGLVLPDDDAYEEARRVWNAAIDRRPAAIVRCADASDADRATQQLAITKIFFIFAASKDATPASKRGRSPWVIQKHLGSAITTFPSRMLTDTFKELF